MIHACPCGASEVDRPNESVQQLLRADYGVELRGDLSVVCGGCGGTVARLPASYEYIGERSRHASRNSHSH